jgi:hypothetical protein
VAEAGVFSSFKSGTVAFFLLALPSASDYAAIMQRSSNKFFTTAHAAVATLEKVS